MDKKRILMAAPYGGVPGGIARWTGHIIKYYNNLINKDVELDLVPMGRSVFTNTSMSVINRFYNILKDYIPIFREFKRKIKQNEYDVFHLTSSGGLSFYKDYIMLKIAKNKNLRTVIHIRFGRLPELSKSQNWEWKQFCKIQRIVDKIIVIDQNTYSALKGCGFKNINILPNPVTPEINEIIDKYSNIKRVDRTILFVGHVVEAKGIVELITACNNIENIKLKIIGTVMPEMRTKLCNLVKDEATVEICGELPYEQIIKNMLMCDVFVLPTYTEGFPNVILESMATGCAIVSTDVGAIPEMLEKEGDKHYGLMVHPRDAIALQTAIERMLNDSALKSECRANAKVRVNERYKLDSVWERMVSIWQTV